MSARNPVVLVIEDDESLRGLIGRVLEKEGFQAILAGNSEEAGSSWAQHKASIELVIADIVTPGLSGPELAREFAADKPGLNVIFISGERRDAALEMTALVEGAAFLPKPFTLENLLKTIRQKLSK